MNRDTMLHAIREAGEAGAPWDIAIIGGGATGLGAALDAAARGYRVCLIERSDFAKGTSSRSTKLVHGGVRHLQQGNVSLVMDALRERGRLLRNAPHLVHDLAFIVPSYAWWESPWYGIGLKVYDALAGRYGFGRSSYLSRDEVIRAIPSIARDGLRGGTRYFDGQFDDARLAIAIARTAAHHGATLVNYCAAVAFIKDRDGVVTGVHARDAHTGEDLRIHARAVINATGPFTDSIRRMDHTDAAPIMRASRGTHIVLERSFLPGHAAIMVPSTGDGRVLFAIPWQGVCIIGTTDEPVDRPTEEPTPTDAEVRFILETANRYLAQPASVNDIRSVFAGIRPLVQQPGKRGTAAISRDHSIIIDQHSGLITIAGGKWTTYRRMAEEVIDHAAILAGLPQHACPTRDLPILGQRDTDDDTADAHPPLSPRLELTRQDVRHACQTEMARTVEDVLSRRTRCLVFDAAAAIEVAPRVAQVMAECLGRDQTWQREQIDSFTRIARGYLPAPTT